jgi:hypothetical protein
MVTLRIGRYKVGCAEHTKYGNCSSRNRAIPINSLRKKNPTGLLDRWVTVPPKTFVSERVRLRSLWII